MNRFLIIALIVVALGPQTSAQAPSAVARPQSLSDNQLPAPIWSGVGSTPAGSSNQRVFLSPDLHSVIILWPNSNGTESKKIFDLRNTIYPELRVLMEGNSGLFRYRYVLENGKQSKDSLRDFSVVIYPDQKIRLSSTEWTIGAIFSNIPHERVGIPGAPSGVLADWTSKSDDEPFLQPGANTSFTISSEAKPGFTSAATEHFPHLDLSDEWPQDVLNQLEPVLDLKWIEYHFITLGPRYGPDDPIAGIANDYLTGIRELIRLRRLEAKSPFIKEAIALLDTIASGSTAQFPLTQKPQNDLESEILNGLRLALQVTYKGPQ